jgi:uncharacterized protein YgbK (DUF1537 family)
MMTEKATSTQTKIIVLDDDPTGSQTVHSCLLLTQWDKETLKVALQDESPLFFVLTNTRGMSAERAASLTREVCHNLKLALEDLKEWRNINPILVSRSDSTLRGHYPVEPNVISEELGPFDAHFLVPAFFEGGRITRNSTHYLVIVDDNGTKKMTPCHETEFARDSVFGYSTAYLPDYVEEKTKGYIRADQVERFLLEDVRGDCAERLRTLSQNVCCVVDCEQQSDLDHFCTQLKQVAAEHGRRFLFRSGASLLTALAQLPPQPVSAEHMDQYVEKHRPGAIVIGSHVQKTSAQLKELLQVPSVEGLEVDVERIKNGEKEAMLSEILEQAREIHACGRHPAIYTSRKELVFENLDQRLEFGEQVSMFLMDVVRDLPPTIGFLISKGGITSNDVLSQGLALSTSRVVGQILPGCSVVRCPVTHPRYPAMPVVIFPGNVGDHHGLATALQRLSNTE